MSTINKCSIIKQKTFEILWAIPYKRNPSRQKVDCKKTQLHRTNVAAADWLRSLINAHDLQQSCVMFKCQNTFGHVIFLDPKAKKVCSWGPINAFYWTILM